MNMIKFDFDDILIEPAIESSIESRKQCDVFTTITSSFSLPLITAPMDTVVNKKNAREYTSRYITVCMPRNENVEEYLSIPYFQSYSLDSFFCFISSGCVNPSGFYLIDIANGHMKKLVNIIKFAKSKYPKITLMVGNVANAQTYGELSLAGADLIRVGIGNGGGCLTTMQTGVGFPMASLIKECYDISQTIVKPAKIVADGGMQKYSDVIKALALGADYVMLGSIFNKAIESCGQNYLWKYIPVSQKVAEFLFSKGFPIYKKFRGMSTKEVQKKWGSKNIKTSEGVVRIRKVEYSLDGWISNFSHYLKTAMSYTDSMTLQEFRERSKINLISQNSFNRFNK